MHSKAHTWKGSGFMTRRRTNPQGGPERDFQPTDEEGNPGGRSGGHTGKTGDEPSDQSAGNGVLSDEQGKKQDGESGDEKRGTGSGSAQGGRSNEESGTRNPS